MDRPHWLKSLTLTAVLQIGADPDDDDATRFQKQILAGLFFTAIVSIIPWILIIAYFGERWAALLDCLALLACVAGLLILAKTKNARLALHTQVAATLFVSFGMTVALGGIGNSSVFILWGFVAILGIATFDSRRRAYIWLGAYLLLVAGAAFGQPFFRQSNNLPPLIISLASFYNIALPMIFAFVTLRYYVERLDQTLRLLRVEQRKAQRLLLNVLPEVIAERLKKEERVIADQYDEVSVLFADVVGFTPLSARLVPQESLAALNEIFSAFDALAARYNVEKIRTIGDGYMAACGVPLPDPRHAQSVAAMALEMADYIHNRPTDSEPIQLRIGINSGPAVAGIVGTTKFHYDVWGDAVNTAARMESHGVPGKIQIGQATHEIIKDEFVCQPRGWIEVKGKGQMQTWFLAGRK